MANRDVHTLYVGLFSNVNLCYYLPLLKPASLCSKRLDQHSLWLAVGLTRKRHQSWDRWVNSISLLVSLPACGIASRSCPHCPELPQRAHEAHDPSAIMR